MGNLLLWFFIAHLENLEDFFIVLSLGLQGINIGFDGRWGFRGSRDARGGSVGFRGAYGLRARGKLRGHVSRWVTIGGVVTSLPATKASALSDALGTFSGREFWKIDSVNIHSIWVSVVPRIGWERRGRSLSSFQG
jgi:hypothetical protein